MERVGMQEDKKRLRKVTLGCGGTEKSYLKRVRGYVPRAVSKDCSLLCFQKTVLRCLSTGHIPVLSRNPYRFRLLTTSSSKEGGPGFHCLPSDV